MKTVTLFRHAKSDWKDSAIIDDFDRPLSERGVKAAPKMGKVIRAHGLMPDIILCSPSVRTRQTLQLAAPNAFETLPEIRFDPKLYHPDVETLLHFLRALPETVAHVMIVGHNPELQELAVTLAAKDDPNRPEMQAKFPTAAIVSFQFEIESWMDLMPEGGGSVAFVTPKSA